MSGFPEVELVFVSGVLDPGIWKHQEKYFSRNCEVTSLGGKNFEVLESELRDILDDSDHAVVVGAELGNLVAQSVEDHENVMSTVITGPFDKTPLPGLYSFKTAVKAFTHPKIAKKVFFPNTTNYSVVKEFTYYTNSLDFARYRSFLRGNLRVPMKNSLIIYNQECRFSSMNAVEDLKPNSEIALLNAGSFSFFEKPQEYNKALHDYLLGKKEFLERRELVKAATENRSLKDFEDKMQLRR